MLLMLLQRTPIVKYAMQFEKAATAPIAKMIRAFTVTAASLGVFHATAGATTFSTAPGRSPFGANVGVDFEISFTVTGAPVQPARWVIKGSVAPGLALLSNTDNELVGGEILGPIIFVRGQPTSTGIYVFSAQAFNAKGDTDNNEYEVQVTVAASAPEFIWSPRSMSVPTGGRAQFFFEAEEEVDTVSWLKNGLPLAGQSASTLILTETTASDGGVYSVSLKKNGAERISEGAILTIDDAAAEATVELSNQGFAEVGSDVLVSLLVVEGPSAATILLRGLGPALEGANALGILGDPRLELSRMIFEDEVEVGSQALLSNDDWEVDPNAAELAAALAVNGKSLLAGSKDAAILVTLPEGVYRIKFSGDASWTGVGLTEMIVVE